MRKTICTISLFLGLPGILVGSFFIQIPNYFHYLQIGDLFTNIAAAGLAISICDFPVLYSRVRMDESIRPNLEGSIENCGGIYGSDRGAWVNGYMVTQQDESMTDLENALHQAKRVCEFPYDNRTPLERELAAALVARETPVKVKRRPFESECESCYCCLADWYIFCPKCGLRLAWV